MPSSLSSTLATPTARSPAGSTAEIRAVIVTLPCRSAGIFGSSSSNRPLSPATTRFGSSLSCHSGGGGHAPWMFHWMSIAAFGTGAPEL